RDRVHGLAAVRLVGDQALRLQLGQARIDCSGAGNVRSAEAVAELLDELVAVHRALAEEAEQVQPQVAVSEDGGHPTRSSAVACMTDTSPPTVLARNSTQLSSSSPYLPV